MRHYIPRTHRKFLSALEAGPGIRPFVAHHTHDYSQLTAVYNACITNLDTFRQKHIEISVLYIIHQAPDSEQAKGTGGTDFVHFLSQARKETRRQRIWND